MKELILYIAFTGLGFLLGICLAKISLLLKLNKSIKKNREILKYENPNLDYVEGRIDVINEILNYIYPHEKNIQN